jgi:hypothetical protein
MKVFLSWSGERSQAVAGALSDLLPDILQGIHPWVSNHDIAPGARWNLKLGQELEGCNFGVLCLTPDNLTSPWLLFEAGSLSKQVEESRVVPFRLGLKAADVPFPLAQFQSVEANENGTRRLVQMLNRAMPEPLEAQRFDRLFERWWPDLKRNLAEAETIPVAVLPQRSDRELIEEMVNLVRGLQQKSLAISQTASDILRFADYPNDSLRPQLRAAKDIALSGLNLSRFFALFWLDIESAIANGARLRVVLVDPDSLAVQMASIRNESERTPDRERQKIVEALELLHSLRKKFPAAIEVRLTSYLAPYSIIVLRCDDPKIDAYCHARLLPFRRSSLRAPIIVPDPHINASWFEFFETQFELQWNLATPPKTSD